MATQLFKDKDGKLIIPMFEEFVELKEYGGDVSARDANEKDRERSEVQDEPSDGEVKYAPSHEDYMVIKTLKEKFPDIGEIKPASDFSDEYRNGIWFQEAGEGGEIDGIPAANYYNEGESSLYDDFGVHNELNAALKELGYYAEWYDAGTLLAWSE